MSQSSGEASSSSSSAARLAKEQWNMVHARGIEEPFTNAKHKQAWKPDWRMPPGVSQWKVLGLVGVIMAASAIPVWGLPWWRGGMTPEQQTKQDSSMVAKQKKREERMRYMQSDDMPRK